MAETVSCACGWDPFVKRPGMRAAVEWDRKDPGEWARKAVRAHIAVNATSDGYHAIVEEDAVEWTDHYEGTDHGGFVPKASGEYPK